MAVVGKRVLLPVVEPKNARGLVPDTKRIAYVCPEPSLSQDEEHELVLDIYPILRQRPCTIPSPARLTHQYLLRKQHTYLPRLSRPCEINPRLATAFKHMLSLDFEEGQYTKTLDGLPCMGTCSDVTKLRVNAVRALGKKGKSACNCYRNSHFFLQNTKPSSLAWTTAIRCEHSRKNDFVTRVWADLLQNQSTQFPLSTLVVRWRLKKGKGYTTENLYEIFETFGKVTTIAEKSFNSAWVVFEEIADACQAMDFKRLGRSDNPLTVTWWHHHMSNKSFAMNMKTGALQAKIGKNTVLRDYRM